MASQARSPEQKAHRREYRHRAGNRNYYEGPEHRIPIPLQYCAVCFLTFGSQETRVYRGEKVAHPRCASRLHRSDAA